MPTKIEKDSVTGQETTGHVWDDIRELNNPLPTWWLWTFYATIVFGIVWMVIYPSLPFWRGTSGWIAREAVVPFPGEGEALHDAAVAFDDVRYLGHAGSAGLYRALAQTDDRLRALRPALLPEAVSA